MRGKNQDVVEHMMERIQQEKDLFERGMQRYTALRTVFTQHTNTLYECIGLETLRGAAGDTRKRIEASPFTKGVRSAMNDFFASIHGGLAQSGRQTGEIHEMMQAMYARFAKEHALETFTPPPFSMLKYQKEVERLERAYNVHFNTLWNMVSKAKFTLMQRFFETVAIRVKHVYDIANRDLDSWLKAVMSPLETQVREHHLQLRRRLESVKRIHRASDELEETNIRTRAGGDGGRGQINALAGELAAIDLIIDQAELTPAGGKRRIALQSQRVAASSLGRRHQPFVLAQQLLPGLDMIRIDRNAVDRADLDALRRIEVADALGAFARDR